MTMYQGINGPGAAIVSIHDVTPAALPDVAGIIEWLKTLAVWPITLLVVPDAGWSVSEIVYLEGLQDEGVDLAGHGWAHHAASRRTPWHRLHGQVLSQHEAEHLSRSAGEIETIILRCHDWFEAMVLNAPQLYVPPAWAMGRISRKALKALPFRFYETLFGLYDSRADRFYRMPVVGYMADNVFRTRTLRISNTFNRLMGTPLRVAIHPKDLHLPLAGDLQRLLCGTHRFYRYGDVCHRLARQAVPVKCRAY
ncbi:MAG: polysaccharide deacetylase family protein [Thermodesulfobacteriota bacterium]